MTVIPPSTSSSRAIPLRAKYGFKSLQEQLTKLDCAVLYPREALQLLLKALLQESETTSNCKRTDVGFGFFTLDRKHAKGRSYF